MKGLGIVRWLLRRYVPLSAAVAASALVAVASTVWACTITMGALTISPTQGAGGTVVTTSATGLKMNPAKYVLHFTVGLTTAGANCMNWSGEFKLKTVATNSSGSWSNVKVTIPGTATLGTHGMCGIETYPTRGQTGTTHDTFTVT